jgi:hypothetical protein
MTRSPARILFVCTLVTLVGGVGIAVTGDTFGWVLVALGAVNGALAVVSYRKSRLPLG